MAPPLAMQPPYQAQRLDIPFAGGLSQKMQAELLDPGSALLQVQSLVHAKSGSLTKPPGFSSLTKATSLSSNLTSADALFGTKDELCVIGSTALGAATSLPHSLFSYSQFADEWVQRGTPSEVVVSKRLEIAAGIVLDQCLCNGGAYLATCWATSTLGASTNVYVSIVDTFTGAVVKGPTALGTAIVANAGSIRLGCAGNTLFYIIIPNGGGQMSFATIDLTSAATINAGWGVLALLPFNSAVNGTLDVMSGTNRIFIAWIDNTGGTFPQTAQYNSAGVRINFGASTAVGGASAVGIGGDETDTIWMTFSAGQNIYVSGYSPTTNAQTAIESVVMVANGVEVLFSLGVISNGTTGHGLVVAGNNRAAGDSTTYWRNFHKNAGTVAGDNVTTSHWRWTPASKPFLVNGRPYVMVCWPFTSQQYLYCIDLSQPSTVSIPKAARAVATISPRLACPPGNSTGSMHAPISVGIDPAGTVVYVANTVLRSATVRGIESVLLDFQNYTNYARAPLLESMNLGGGTPGFYDGAVVAEQGFLNAPEILSTSTFSGGAGATFPAGGTWSWVAVYRHVDARGQIHRSAPSAPFIAIQGGGGGTLNYTAVIGTLSLTQRAALAASSTPVVIELYRTTNGGTVYYLVNANTIPNNDPSVTSVSIVDSTTDAALTGHALCYTQPGTLGTSLPHVNPPGFTWMIAHNDLLWGIEGQNVWYSGQAVVGEGTWWSDAFQLAVLGGNGPLTAMASMDGRLFLFKHNAIFVVDGRGAADNGSGNDLSNPQMLPVDCGCINPRSVVVTSEGIWFQSARGLELLNRSMQLEPFAGQQVEDQILPGYVVASATVDEEHGRVYFLVRQSDSSATTGGFVVRDLVQKTWTTRVFDQGRCGDMIGSGGNDTPYFAYVSDQAIAHQEHDDDYLDAGGFLPSSLTTGWIKVGGILGFQRVRYVHLFLEMKDPADINVFIATDYSGSASQVVTFTDAQLNAMPSRPFIHLSIHVKQQKCSSIQVQITDAVPTGGRGVTSGQGIALLGMSLELAVMDNQARVPKAQKG